MATPDKFFDLVQRSKLVEGERLSQFISGLRSTATPDQLEDTQFVVNEMIKADLLTAWQAERIKEGKYKGFVIGKYKLLSHIGTGGMSNVYLAEHTLMHRRVAIKILPKSRVDDSSYLARFYLEAQAAAKLDHPNVIKAYDIEEDKENKLHFIVMEYVEGQDLQQLVKANGPLPYAAAAEYIAQAAGGLAHAHAAGLIHRDIKPSNLLVDGRGTVKILDMGLAKFSDTERASLTVAYDENVLGTADYLAPEQARDSHNVDLRADLYSLGCTLYFLLTGHPPFPDGTLPQRLLKHQMEEPPSILVDRPDAPADLIAICQHMMAKKAENRFASATDVGQALRNWLSGHNVFAVPPPPASPGLHRSLSSSADTHPGMNPDTIKYSGPSSQLDLQPLELEEGSSAKLRKQKGGAGSDKRPAAGEPSPPKAGGSSKIHHHPPTPGPGSVKGGGSVKGTPGTKGGGSVKGPGSNKGAPQRPTVPDLPPVQVEAHLAPNEASKTLAAEWSPMRLQNETRSYAPFWIGGGVLILILVVVMAIIFWPK